jgi:TP901 family phage tail tape measure protein
MAKTVYQILVELEGDKAAKDGMESLGKAAGVTGAALTAVGVGAGKLAAEYDFALRKVGTVSDETTGTLEELDQAFYGLSEQMGGAINVNQAAQASYSVASAGYKNQADILGILETSQKAAIGGYSELGEVSSAVTKIMNSFGDTLGENLTVTEKAQKVTDLLIQTQNDGETTVGQLAAGYGQIAATAAAAGVEFEVVNAFLANSTAKGLSTSSAIAGLTQVIAGIQKPTSEAAEEAERLGIGFDATALKTKGLDGILLEIANSSNLADDSIAKLFGSTEAQTVINQALINSGQDVITSLDNQREAVGTTQAAYDDMSDAISVKADKAFNKLQNTLIKLGEGVLIAVEPAIEAIDFLITNFQKLPTPVQQAIGLATILGGAALTVGGGVLILAANVSTLATNVSSAVPVVSKLVKEMLTMQKLNYTSMAGGIKAMGSAAVAAAPLLIALAGAVVSVGAAWRQYQNIQTQFQNADIQAQFDSTEPLAKLAIRTAQQIRESGEAIEDSQFDEIMKQLKAASEQEGGSLDGVIEALQRVQDNAKGAADATNDKTQASKDATGVNQELATSEEDLAQSEAERAADFQEYFNSRMTANQQLSQELQNRLTDIELEKTSEAQAIQDKLAAQQQYYNQINANQQALLQQSQLTGEQRKQLELAIQQNLTNIARAEAEARKALLQVQISEVETRLQAAKTEIDGLIALANVQAESNQTTLSYVGNVKGLMGEIDGLINDTNSSLAFRNELWSIGNQLSQSLVDMGLLQENQLLTQIGLEETGITLERLEITLKQEQLAIERQLIELEAEGRRAEIEGQMEIARIKQENAQTNEERAQADATLRVEQQKLEVLEKQTQARLRGNQLAQEITSVEGQISDAKAREARRDSASPSGQSGQPKESQSEKETAEATKKTAEATKENTNVSSRMAENLDEQASQTQESLVVSQEAAGHLKSIAGFSKGILDNTSAVVRQLDFIQKQLSALPAQIAARMPKPRPAPKSRD